MNYDEFRTTWHRALNEAGLLRFPAYPSETIELRWLRREYGLNVRPHDQQATCLACGGVIVLCSRKIES